MLELREHAGDLFLAEEVQRPEIVEDAIDLGRHPAVVQGVMHQGCRYTLAPGRPREQVVMWRTRAARQACR